MKIASSYIFGSNALFVSQKLRADGLNAVIKEVANENYPFQVLVSENDLDTALALIEKLNIIENDLDPESKGYLLGHQEWNDHTINPGHYTGEKMEHWLYNKEVWKYLAPMYLLSGIALLALIVYGNMSINFETGMWLALYLFIGGSMLWQLKKKG